METKELTIRKINFSDKWMEIWIDGLPYNKKTEWDDEKEEHYKTNEDNWNFSCKSYMFKNWWDESKPEVNDNFEDLLFWNGWNYFIGKKLQLHNNGTEIKFI